MVSRVCRILRGVSVASTKSVTVSDFTAAVSLAAFGFCAKDIEIRESNTSVEASILKCLRIVGLLVTLSFSLSIQFRKKLELLFCGQKAGLEGISRQLAQVLVCQLERRLR